MCFNNFSWYRIAVWIFIIILRYDLLKSFVQRNQVETTVITVAKCFLAASLIIASYFFLNNRTLLSPIAVFVFLNSTLDQTLNILKVILKRHFVTLRSGSLTALLKWLFRVSVITLSDDMMTFFSTSVVFCFFLNHFHIQAAIIGLLCFPISFE